MTKAQEIAALDRFIDQLGPDSYLGPWLSDNRTAIVADIAGDRPVELLFPGLALRHAADIIAEARVEAERIHRAGIARDEELRQRTQKACDDQRRVVAGLIERHAAEAVRQLGR